MAACCGGKEILVLLPGTRKVAGGFPANESGKTSKAPTTRMNTMLPGDKSGKNAISRYMIRQLEERLYSISGKE